MAVIVRYDVNLEHDRALEPALRDVYGAREDVNVHAVYDAISSVRAGDTEYLSADPFGFEHPELAVGRAMPTVSRYAADTETLDLPYDGLERVETVVLDHVDSVFTDLVTIGWPPAGIRPDPETVPELIDSLGSFVTRVPTVVGEEPLFPRYDLWRQPSVYVSYPNPDRHSRRSHPDGRSFSFPNGDELSPLREANRWGPYQYTVGETAPRIDDEGLDAVARIVPLVPLFRAYAWCRYHLLDIEESEQELREVGETIPDLESGSRSQNLENTRHARDYLDDVNQVQRYGDLREERRALLGTDSLSGHVDRYADDDDLLAACLNDVERLVAEVDDQVTDLLRRQDRLANAIQDRMMATGTIANLELQQSVALLTKLLLVLTLVLVLGELGILSWIAAMVTA